MMSVSDDRMEPGPRFADERQPRRLVLMAIVRVVVLTVFVMAAYFAVPVGQDADGLGVTVLVIGAVGFIGALVYQVRQILDSPAPQLRAAEALATTAVMVIVVFAFTYACMSVTDAASFSEPITKVNGLYFTVTVLATVGFGDIAARTDAARLVVTGQMLLDLLIVGVVVKVLIGASRIGVERRRSEDATARATQLGGRSPVDAPEPPSTSNP